MKVLDLFSGLEGWSQAFKERHHEVITVDNQERFNPTICQDIETLKPEQFRNLNEKFDIILASPPCNHFSIASVYRHWTDGRPNPETIKSIRLVGRTIWLIMTQHPRWWILENPRGMMRKVLGKPQVMTYFASWQSDKEREELYASWKCDDKTWKYLKPTDLWGVFPKSLKFPTDKPTDYVKAPRSSHVGIQGQKDKALRAKIPYNLSLAVCKACEKELSIPPQAKASGILEATL